jgi:NADH-quinone oxidoreductase subunit M
VLQGAAQAYFPWAIFAAVGVILSAVYMLWLYQRTFFGKVNEGLAHHMWDLNAREWAAMLPLLILMVWMGTFTQTFMPPISSESARILDQTKTGVETRVANHTPPIPHAALLPILDGQELISAR